MLTYFELVKTGSGRVREGPAAAATVMAAASSSSKGVTMDKFVDYYADLSAAVDDDDYFLGLVNSNWALVIQE